jgi:hypothetical protein
MSSDVSTMVGHHVTKPPLYLSCKQTSYLCHSVYLSLLGLCNDHLFANFIFDIVTGILLSMCNTCLYHYILIFLQFFIQCFFFKMLHNVLLSHFITS